MLKMIQLKSKLIQSLLVIIICGIVIISLGNVDFLPWWIFLLPILILGSILTLLKLNLNAFMLGFISGFLMWFGGNLLFDFQYDGSILAKCANLLSIPKILLVFLSGIIGGILTGTAMYVGKNIFKNAKQPNAT